MKSEIVQVKLEDNNIEKYQIITGFKWEDLNFKYPSFNNKTIKAISSLYDINIIPKTPNLYGFLIFYNIGDIEINLDRNTDIGYIINNQILLNYYFNKAIETNEIKIENNYLIFDNKILQKYFDELVNTNYVEIIKGNLDTIDFLPISRDIGYLSKIEKSSLLVNSHFFLLDKTDIDCLYDEIGTSHGLVLKNSIVSSPPLNHRESLLVDYDNNVLITNLEVTDFKIQIDNNIFLHNINSQFYYRPETRVTPKCDGVAIVIIKNKVVAIKDNGEAVIPMAGFVIQTSNKISLEAYEVSYLGESNNYKFGIQVGPALMVKNEQVKKLFVPFYKGEGTPFPATCYPLDFKKARAARIGLGIYKETPILIWAEGAGKLGHIKGEESCGVSLLEFGNFCNSFGISDFVNLDGGGSAQILLNNKRALKIADRENDAITEIERPLPIVLCIK